MVCAPSATKNKGKKGVDNQFKKQKKTKTVYLQAIKPTSRPQNYTRTIHREPKNSTVKTIAALEKNSTEGCKTNEVNLVVVGDEETLE